VRSRFRILGHPVHPMLVPIPIGLFTWVIISDIAYLFGGRSETWYTSAMVAGFIGVGAAVVAAVPGLVDFAAIADRTRARRLGVIHMVLNLSLAALFLFASLLMLGGRAEAGGTLGIVIAAHVIGFLMLGVSGWLGGEMVYRHHLTIEPEGPAEAERERARHELPGGEASQGQARR
jgi:uncharacterized membrane protein